MKSRSLKHSLRLRLGIGIGIGLLMCAMSVLVYFLVKHSLAVEVDRAIQQTAALLADQIEIEDGQVIFEWQEGQGTNSYFTRESWFQFWDDRTGETTRSLALGEMDLPKFTGKGGRPEFRTVLLPNGHRARAVGLRAHDFFLTDELAKQRAKAPNFDPAAYHHTLVVAKDLESSFHTLEWLRNVLISGTFLLLLTGFIVIEHVVGDALHPVQYLIDQINRRASNKLSDPLDVPEELPREIVGLARDFDKLLARLSAAREREKGFIRHAAHELRTPIAGLSAITELALSKPRNSDEYLEHLQTCNRSAKHLAEVVSRLSALARLESRHADQVEMVVFDPAEVISESIAAARGSSERKLVWNAEQCTARAVGDVGLVRLILKNLLENALAHGAPAGEIHISCGKETSDSHHVCVRVNNVLVSEPEDVEAWFAPFFRSEARADDAHFGIGLALCRSAAQAMQAVLRAEVVEGPRVVFTLSLAEAQ